MPQALRHPQFSRRTMIQAGSVGLLGLGMNHLAALRQADGAAGKPKKIAKAKSVIYIFLSGGMAQQDSFDPKPDGPASIRGEFAAVSTKTPGVQICEHLPMLAARSDKWALVRSLTHPYNEHSNGHMVMLMDEFVDMGATSPQRLGGSPVTLHVTVPDVDAAFERAVSAGATVVMPVADQFWGDRYGSIRDPFGHSWSLATHVRDMTPEEIRKAMAEAMPG